VNAGASYKLAEALHEHIRKITDEPVKFVILENGQGHAMLGSNYWKEQGVPIIAHEETATEISEHGHEALDAMRQRIKEQADKSEVVAPDITFTERHVIELGDWRIEALHLGPAHSPGDTMV
jgi:glyoxylase-like metal-dependent hydrolase (beta-lactamase superfamily II)